MRLKIRMAIFAGALSCVFLHHFVFSQVPESLGKNDIRGRVTESRDGEALPYANILVKGTNMGTTSNTNGYFVIVNVPIGICTLQVRYIGYAPMQVELNNFQGNTEEIEIALQQSILMGEDVTIYAEEYQIFKASREVSKLTFSTQKISTLPNLGEEDIFRSLQLLPGVSAANEGSSGLYVRGGTPDQNLVLLDGMTVYHVDHFYGFFSAFNADAVKDVQLYKGGYPAKYGGRLSSVVELTGKTGGTNKPHFNFGVNLLSLNGTAQVPLSNKASFLLSLRRSYTDVLRTGLYNSLFDYVSGGESTTPVTVLQGGGFRGRFGGGARGGFQQENMQPDFYFYDINSKLTYVPTDRDVLSVSFYNGKDNLYQGSELGGLTDRGGGFFNRDRVQVTGTRINEETTKWGNLGASAKWSHQWGARLNSTFLLAASNYFSDNDIGRRFDSDEAQTESDSSRAFRGAGSFASEEKNKISDVSLRFDNEWHMSGAHTIGFGAWASSISTDYTATINDTITTIDRTTDARQTTLYLQDNWRVFRPLELTLGARGTYFDLTQAYYWEPRASVVLSLTEQLRLKGAWGKYHQYINRITNENVLEGSRDFWLVADDNLKPSSAIHNIAGISYETRNYLFEVEGYYKDLDNLIEFSRRFQQNADYGSLFFVGTGVARGVEFLVQKKLGALNGWVSYTLGKVAYTFPALNNGEPFPATHDRRHEGNFVTTYSRGLWNFSMTWVFASGQAYTSPESQYYLGLLDGGSQGYIHIGGKNAQRLPDYHRMDVSVSRTFNTEKLQFEAGLSVFNVYNRSNIQYRKYDLDVNPILITDVTTLGITPSLFFKAKL